jgi:hypothetical protein
MSSKIFWYWAYLQSWKTHYPKKWFFFIHSWVLLFFGTCFCQVLSLYYYLYLIFWFSSSFRLTLSIVFYLLFFSVGFWYFCFSAHFFMFLFIYFCSVVQFVLLSPVCFIYYFFQFLCCSSRLLLLCCVIYSTESTMTSICLVQATSVSVRQYQSIHKKII